ncbi:unnamed protein product [Rhizoctonia solani]|uniref:Nephrocystin 3-like N-terminal domain-containing protein n=1 Tax=Rhizoctonia solani TaxID=456999 RepID=A0A8H2XZR3_9AGAM|nr:unnamed protein product [Rhizoctonia solani]
MSSSEKRSWNFKGVRKLRKSIWSRLETALLKLGKSAKVFPPLGTVISELIDCMDIPCEGAASRKEHQQQEEELKALKQCVIELQNTSGHTSGGYAGILQLVLYFKLCSKQLLNSPVFESKRRRRHIETQFRQLQMETNALVYKNSRIQLQMSLIQLLSPAQYARYNSSNLSALQQLGRVEETDAILREEVYGWAIDENSPKIYWMTGGEKTTIAYDLCKWLDEKKQLGASFFCSSDHRTHGECNRIIPTIAYQLARHSQDFQSYLCKTILDDPDIVTLDTGQQLNALILDRPRDRERENSAEKTNIVVINALNECKNQSEVDLMMKVLLNRAKSLPFKVFVTSRSKPPAEYVLPPTEGRFSPVLRVLDISNDDFSHPPLENNAVIRTKQCGGKETPSPSTDTPIQAHTIISPPLEIVTRPPPELYGLQEAVPYEVKGSSGVKSWRPITTNPLPYRSLATNRHATSFVLSAQYSISKFSQTSDGLGIYSDFLPNKSIEWGYLRRDLVGTLIVSQGALENSWLRALASILPAKSSERKNRAQHQWKSHPRGGDVFAVRLYSVIL